MRPRLAITPIRPQCQHGRMAWAKPTSESNEEPHIARKETDVTKKDPVWDASCDKISNQNVYLYHFSQNRVLFSLSRPISTTCVLSPRFSLFSGRMLYGYPDPQHRLQQKCVLHLEITTEAWLSHLFAPAFNAPHLMMRLCRFPAASSCVP